MVEGREPNYSQLQQAFSKPASEVDTVNEFVFNSRLSTLPKEQLCTVETGRIFARLQTPLNSSFNLAGDTVKAVVVGSEKADGKPWLEEGSILEGCVESSEKSKFNSTDGAILVRFYSVRVRSRVIDISSVGPDTQDQMLRPNPNRTVSKKQRARGILMTATRMAVPMAIGSGGLSLAITSGAGAVIGGALAEKGKHVEGAVKGALEGAGMGFINPLITKGESVIMAQGTPLILQLSESIRVPKYDCNSKEQAGANQISGSASILKTSAKILTPDNVAETSLQTIKKKKELLDSIDQKLAQSDLASAVALLEEAENVDPDDSQIKALHGRIFNFITKAKTSENVSDNVDDSVITTGSVH